MRNNKETLLEVLGTIYEDLDDETIETYFKALEAIEKGFCLGVYGSYGVGKTTLLYNFRKWGLIKFYPFTEKEIRNDFASHGNEGIKALYKYEHLLIDDIGSSENKIVKYMGNELHVIEDLLYVRLEKGLKTHFTTNMKPEVLKDYLGIRAYDRIEHRIELIEYVGKSKRVKKPIEIPEESIVNIEKDETVDWNERMQKHIQECRQAGRYIESRKAVHFASQFFLELEKQGKINIPLQEKHQRYSDEMKSIRGYFLSKGQMKEDSQLQGIAIIKCRTHYYKEYISKLLKL